MPHLPRPISLRGTDQPSSSVFFLIPLGTDYPDQIVGVARAFLPAFSQFRKLVLPQLESPFERWQAPDRGAPMDALDPEAGARGGQI